MVEENPESFMLHQHFTMSKKVNGEVSVGNQSFKFFKMELARYILDCLSCQKMIVWSWGFNSPVALTDGLQFKVQGFVFQGIVQILYNEGTDYFEIKLIKNNVVLVYIPDVEVSELIEVIDNHVEKVENYDERVKKEYDL